MTLTRKPKVLARVCRKTKLAYQNYTTKTFFQQNRFEIVGYAKKMAALSRSLTRSISLLGRYRDKVRIPVCSSVSRRFLRLDHEEEIEQLFLKDSFDERLSKLKSNVGQVEPRLLGEAFKDVRDRPTRAKIAPAGKQNTGTSNDVGEDDIDIPLEEVYEDSIHESGCSHAIPLLKHYGVFQDQIGRASCRERV